jgi:DEAD/DEAH box helicase domain-containing protein
VFVYEGHAGGVGIAARAFARLPELLGRVGRLLDECPCEEGCPSCVHSPKCGNGNRPLDKRGARRVVALLLGEEPCAGLAEPWPLSLASPEEELGADEEGSTELPAVVAAGSDRAAGRPERTATNGAPHASRGDERGHAPAATTNGHAPAPRSNGHAIGLRPAPAGRPELVAPVDAGHVGAVGRIAAALRARWRRWWLRRVRPAVPPLHPAPDGGDTLLFDLETIRSAADVGGWGNAHRMGLALAVVCRLEEDRFEIFREGDARALAAALRGARLVIGFNVRRFDYRVLAGYTGADYNRLVPTLDLLEDVHRALGFRLRLDDLARATLGSGKTADGLQSLEWVRAGRLDLVEDYCRHDVEVLRDLYLFGRREGYVVWRDREERRMRLPVRW